MSAARGHGAGVRPLGGGDAWAEERAGRDCFPEKWEGGGRVGEEPREDGGGGAGEVSFDD